MKRFLKRTCLIYFKNQLRFWSLNDLLNLLFISVEAQAWGNYTGGKRTSTSTDTSTTKRKHFDLCVVFMLACVKPFSRWTKCCELAFVLGLLKNWPGYDFSTKSNDSLNRELEINNVLGGFHFPRTLRKLMIICLVRLPFWFFCFVRLRCFPFPSCSVDLFCKIVWRIIVLHCRISWSKYYGPDVLQPRTKLFCVATVFASMVTMVTSS